MMLPPAIVTLTLNPAIDLSYEVDALVPTQKLRTPAESLYPGGGGINVARMLARLGREATCVYMAGGETGPTFAALLAERGLKATCVPTRGATRIATTVLETGSGKEFRLTPPGPDVSETEWRACLDTLARLQLRSRNLGEPARDRFQAGQEADPHFHRRHPFLHGRPPRPAGVQDRPKRMAQADTGVPPEAGCRDPLYSGRRGRTGQRAARLVS
ncbi:MAG: hypothetical protein FJX31_07585 [Alphaproteobacteria bacterium]|nr:hypothetical protein [Alphaproteobacteria bacterium]